MCKSEKKWDLKMTTQERLARFEELKRRQLTRIARLRGRGNLPSWQREADWLIAELEKAWAREEVMREAMTKVSVNKDMCVYGTYDMEPDPEKAFRQGSHIAFCQSAEVADEALKDIKGME